MQTDQKHIKSRPTSNMLYNLLLGAKVMNNDATEFVPQMEKDKKKFASTVDKLSD